MRSQVTPVTALCATAGAVGGRHADGKESGVKVQTVGWSATRTCFGAGKPRSNLLGSDTLRTRFGAWRGRGCGLGDRLLREWEDVGTRSVKVLGLALNLTVGSVGLPLQRPQ